MSPTSHDTPQDNIAHVVAVRENLVTVETKARIMKNEVAYIHCGEQRLKSEVLRIQGDVADLQVYESTLGIKVGDKVELSGEMLSAVLGPGLLGQVFDGLQNPLHVLARQNGFFLQRGVYVSPLDENKKWAFTPTALVGDIVGAGDVLGTVQEGRFTHKIMVPFSQNKTFTVDWIQKGNFNVNTSIVGLVNKEGESLELNMLQHWPIRHALPDKLVQTRKSERLYPHELLTTSLRIVDTFFPIARGGTACIPGPFGAGKTVLQSLIARYSAVDVVIIVACGERAGEVVDTITEFPQMLDPMTGSTLMERTIIIANTSSMPVAARESSIYMGITLAEYYRQMGMNTLVIADSTSRWAQAMRETSGRMEEIPGEDAFPAYIDSSIKNIYERAGVIKTNDGSTGSMTIIGTVSPAGGNFEEPVTQSTLSAVKSFLGLSSQRAYRRYYPAIDPLLSWSRYFDQLQVWYKENLSANWYEDVQSAIQLLHKGEAIYQMMQVTGEEGVSLNDYLVWQKAKLLDNVYLQQDAFDEVDVSTSLPRQKETFELITQVINSSIEFEDKQQLQQFFTKLTRLFKNYNFSPKNSEEYKKFKQEIYDEINNLSVDT
jgi:V/A-type H+-transporting ATPase subunit A